ncbi:beta-ketoacyl synthase N-terminal-like domain-containing protein [Robiginitalea sediminis]|uniref:beta-ketoacyl synthase N-terminal-like domain-containing protein n=1 Tax=Robiginitalea sediminis TaxID=1982593 RepID=UPI000B4C071E|nr:beta-ketoacyl synthase N-terminal-like domain-containing protein [Robiginitalea sediminis]
MKISIRSLASLSALGDEQDASRFYSDPQSRLTLRESGGQRWWAGAIPEPLKEQLRASLESYGRLDDTVLYALWVSRKALQAARWAPDMRIGVNLGSSRGATGLWESHHGELLRSGSVNSHASPSTTLGNIASWVAHDLGTLGPAISHSITCSTALHALLNGCAWIRSGMADGFLVGGAEAPLTDFTFKQMAALKIYSQEAAPYPCRALDPRKESNTMVLGEGAGVVALEGGAHEDALAVIAGVGYATEPLTHAVSLSADAGCLQRSMTMALGETMPSDVDAIVLHAPGTRLGDRAELRAVEQVFRGAMPALTSNKWKIGHTLGASGLLSLELALYMLERQEIPALPYLGQEAESRPIRRVMVNAVGFGGNAVSVLLERPGEGH